MDRKSMMRAVTTAGAAGIAVAGATGFAAPANAATSSTAPGNAVHAGGRAQLERSAKVTLEHRTPGEIRALIKSRLAQGGTDGSKGLGSGCTGYAFDPTHVGGSVTTFVDVQCGTLHDIGACTSIWKLRWFGWSQITNPVCSFSYSTVAVAAAYNYCKGAGTYTYLNSAYMSRSNYVATSAPTNRFTC